MAANQINEVADFTFAFSKESQKNCGAVHRDPPGFIYLAWSPYVAMLHSGYGALDETSIGVTR